MADINNGYGPMAYLVIIVMADVNNGDGPMAYLVIIVMADVNNGYGLYSYGRYKQWLWPIQLSQM